MPESKIDDRDIEIAAQAIIRHCDKIVANRKASQRPEVGSSEWVDAISLLKESRECIAACFRTIAASDDKMIMDRLEMQLALAGVEHGIGVRLQNFIKASTENKMSDGGRERASLGVEVWKSSQKLSVQRSAVRSIVWLGASGGFIAVVGMR
jgi:hypothetical protein